MWKRDMFPGVPWKLSDGDKPLMNNFCVVYSDHDKSNESLIIRIKKRKG